MSAHLDDQAARLGIRARLFEPGERLGWIFRDRNQFLRAFPEQPPPGPGVPQQVEQEFRRRKDGLTQQLTISGSVAGAGLVVLMCCVFLADGTNFVEWLFRTAAVVAAGLALLAWPAVVIVRYLGARSARDRSLVEARHRHAHSVELWESRRVQHSHTERQRVDQLAEWGAASPRAAATRLDVYGGSLWGWEAFLTVFGASLISSRSPVTLVDLSREFVSGELLALTRGAGRTVSLQRIPTDLAECDLLANLDARQLVDVLVESMYGDEATARRADRSMDDRLLTAICQVLGDDLSLARLAEALRALMGAPAEPRLLSREEWRTIASDLFSADYIQQAHASLRRIEAFVHPLEGLGVRRGERRATDLDCLSLDGETTNAQGELLTDLIVQWMTRRIATGLHPSRSLIIVGADDLQRRHIERLSDICDRRGVRLVLLFRHLREQALGLIGGGAVGFMRLGNHEEAERAANFIGREHSFVMSQLTRSLGGNETHTTTTSETEGTSAGSSFTVLGALAGKTIGKSRSWGESLSHATGTNWSDASSEQRVYEYRVEPRTLQDLPDYGLVLVESAPGGPQLRPVECNPDILSLPRVTTQPLASVPEQIAIQSIAPARELGR